MGAKTSRVCGSRQIEKKKVSHGAIDKKEKKKEQTFAKKKRERNIFEKTNSSITLKLQKGIHQKSGSNKRPWSSIKQDSVCWFHLRHSFAALVLDHSLA